MLHFFSGILHDGGKPMGEKRTLQQLTIKDNFMFTAVMMDESNF